jgi:xanthine dehydrogenase accessory factor
MMADRQSVWETARDWLVAGERVALATVVATWSSSPRPIGSQMAIASDGRFAGSVSGGCVEAAVIVAAAQLFAGGSPGRTLEYGVSLEQAWEVGLPCGGKITIALAETSLAVLEPACAARARRETVVIVSDVDTGVAEPWDPHPEGRPEPGSLAGESLASRLRRDETSSSAIAAIVRRERSELLEVGGRRIFVLVAAAPLRLIAVGAVHLTQALCDLALLSGIAVWVVDPRTAFATPERFPGVFLEHDWPDLALAKIGLDRRTAVVVLSHDEKIDEPALHAALQSDCFYVGALGSQRTQRARRERLAAAGFGEASLARIHGPIGLDIGALTTPEIAISIMAELIAAWRRA